MEKYRDIRTSKGNPHKQENIMELAAAKPQTHTWMRHTRTLAKRGAHQQY
jgi:hypothetical protein